ncbi:MAG: hypothetical protein NC915_05235 [Candidatus Omnitrophica bacterium]|nr:hypothetical protein [Candidatus Omnitrophota bacterium]
MKFKFYFIFSVFITFIFAEEIKYTGENMVVSFDEKGEIEKIYLEGKIVIYYKDIVFKSEKAIYDRKNNEIQCEGNVEVLSNTDKFYADWVRYDLENEVGFIENAKFKIESFFFNAKNLERKGETLKLKDGYLTTCDLEKPHYKISAGKIEFVKDNYIKCEKFKIVMGDKFTVFYLPKFTIDLETKKPFFIPSISYKTRTGLLAGLTLNFKPFEKKDYLLSGNFLLGAKGGGIGLGLFSQKNNIDSKMFFLKIWNQDKIHPGGYFEMNRNFGKLDFLIDWRWMYDDEFFIDFFKDEFSKKSKMYNYFSLTGQLGKGIWGLTIREKAKEEILKVEKLPELRYYLPYLQFTSLPLFLSYDFRLTNFYKNEETYLRILNKLDLTYKKDFSYFTLKPYLSFSSLNYESSTFDKFNYIGDVGLNFTTLFYTNLLNKDIIFIPSLSIFSRKTKYNPDQLVQFDDFEEKWNGNFISTDLRWNINSENNFSGNFEIENRYNFDRGKFEDILLKYEFNKGSFKIEGENQWNIENNLYKFGVNTISYEKEKYKFSIGTRVDNDAEISGIEAWWQQVLKNDWNYRIGIFYNFDSKELLNQSYEIWKNFHCLTIDFRITKDKENTSFYILIIPSVFFENNWQRRFTKWK